MMEAPEPVNQEVGGGGMPRSADYEIGIASSQDEATCR
jgi:hypothetical protein